MTEERWLLILPRGVTGFIESAGSWGNLTCRISKPDLVAKVIAISDGDALPQRLIEDPSSFMASADAHGAGHWYRAGDDVAALAFFTRRQGLQVPFEAFRNAVPELRDPGVDGWYIAVTFTDAPPEIAPGRTLPRLAAWHVSRSGVEPLECDVEPEPVGIELIAPHWPVAELQQSRVLLIGAGSIGGATARALAAYGVGHLDVLDPDRLLSHNVPRHVCSTASVGKYKVEAVAELLGREWPQTEVRAFRADAIEDADVARALIAAADMVICTVDGVEPRRVISYLCKRAGKPLVLACVLSDGRYGEVLRMRPFIEVGCLDCQRRALADHGHIDLETTLDRGYGEGTRHNPMTAVGGDLHLVGMLAAKTAIATLLSTRGHTDQLLEEDNMVVSLRPEPGLAAPFDSSRLLAQSWYPSTAPYPDCIACRPNSTAR